MSNRSNSLIKNDLANNHGKRYMAQTTLTLFVLGSALETSVDICDNNTVHDANGSHDVSIGLLKIDHLKKLIWNIIKESEENINKAIRLELWKVEIPRDDKELVLLNEMFNKGQDIKNKLGKDLNQGDLYEEYFPSEYHPPLKKIHIVVKPPKPATTGKRKAEESRENENRKKEKPEYPTESKEGRDSLLVIYERLNKIIDFVENNRVSLLRSPPSSGKSTLGQTLRDHFELVNAIGIYISLAGISDKARENEELFEKFWDKEVGYTWTSIVDSTEQKPFYVFVDEIQVIYGKCARHFWGSIKTMMSSECTKNIHILLIGTYDPILGVESTPVTFGDSNSLSLKDLLLTREELKLLVTSYSQIRATSGSPKFKIPGEIEDAIFRLTNGHPGLCRIILDSLHNHYKNGPATLEMLRHLASTNLKNYLYTESRALCWIANWDMSANDSKLIRDMIYITRNGITSNYDCEDPIIKNFLKIGLLVKDVNSTQPKFTAPILLIILSHHIIGSNYKSLQKDPTRQDFNEFLIRSIERMSQHILSESYGRGVNGHLYEVGWQNEWYRSAVSVVPLGTSVSANVGYVFGSNGYLDYYINGEICWGIELTREGNQLAEHAKRFYENGKYENIPLKEWVILDFRHHSKTVEELKRNFWYILYSDDYSHVTIRRSGHEDKIFYLQK